MRKSILFLLFFVSVFFSGEAFSASGKMNRFKDAEFKQGLVAFRIKQEYRSLCQQGSVQIPALNKALTKISAHGLQKKFPHSRKPSEEFNKYGQKLIDLSLIYQVQFSPVIKMEYAIEAIMASGVLEYAEPLFIHRMNFTPNDPNIVSQYYIAKISAYTAWDIWKGDTNTVIGIVDSGTDWDHPDLEGNIKYNYADPIDGLDNDGDGFTDNFRGWDVSGNDNNPMVAASLHGSHVSGCAAAVTNNATGVASPAFNCRFLPVKSSADASATSIDDGYDGIVYAADHGCQIINCSWGRTGLPSILEQETIDYATINKEALVVAAAGNNIYDVHHYPASYENVISVAATTSSDAKASFSNYNDRVDVCAPGNNINSTYFNNTYANLDGTSMASPIAAGVAAMIKSRFPTMTPLQVGEQMRATCDNINGASGNTALIGRLGKGRVNMYKALTDTLCPGVVMKKDSAFDGYDNVFIPGDTLSLVCLFENLLRPTANLTCSLSTSNSNVQILQNTFNGGVLGTFDTVSNYMQPYKVIVLQSAPLNTEVVFRVTITDGTWSDVYNFDIVVNVDYINIAVNNVSTSITSKGLIGYNETGQNQGLGFTYMNSASILYDMGLMVGAQGTQVSDNMRSDQGNDADFSPFVNVTSLEPGIVSDFDVNGIFKDNGATSANPLSLEIRHSAFAWISPPDDNYVMVRYIIKNNGSSSLTNMYAGLFADWDIQTYANNKCSTDSPRKMGYTWNTDPGGLYGAMKLLSYTGGFVHYALDNTANNGGIEMNDGYSNSEKYTSLSTMRTNAGTATTAGNDVLNVVSSGGFTLAAGDSIEVAFALIAGPNLASIQASADAAQAKYDQIFIGIESIGSADGNKLFPSFPNPAKDEVKISFSLKEGNDSELSIYNILGVKVKAVFNERLSSGQYSVSVNLTDLPSGNYFYKLTSGGYSQTLPLVISR
jgi:serine protease